MKKVILILIVLISVIALITGIDSCSKDTGKNIDPQSGKDYLQAVSVYTDVFKQVDFAILNPTSNLGKKLNSYDTLCVNISITPNDSTYPKTIIITYDTVKGCSIDGIVRKGRITAILSGQYKQPGTTVNISFNNYSMNSNAISGLLMLTNTGRNSQNYPVFNLDIAQMGILLKDLNIIEFSGQAILTWINGENDKGISSSIYTMTETTNGTNINQKGFSVTTINPITLSFNCPFRIKSGKSQVTPANGDLQIIDFGSSNTCTGKAVLSSNSLSDINLTFN